MSKETGPNRVFALTYYSDKGFKQERTFMFNGNLEAAKLMIREFCHHKGWHFQSCAPLSLDQAEIEEFMKNAGNNVSA